MTMKKIIYSLLLASGLLSTSCNDYLDVVPKGDVETIETNFEQRNDVDKWLKTCYAMFTNMATSYDEQPGFFGADEFVGGQYFRDNMAAYGPAIYIGDGLQMAQNPYCNIWSKDGAYCLIRYCNLFIDNVDLCQNMTKDEKTLWKAEIKALKASTYFELLKRYGSFILVPENIDANADKVAMQQPRASIDDCVNAIVSLCDEAIADLPTMSGSEESRHAYFKKESTAAVKAYALLFAASPLFNGNEQLKNFTNKNGERLFPVYDKEKWHKAAIAADEAINYALAGGKHLYNSTNDKGTDMLNTIFNIQQSVLDKRYTNPEILLEFEGQYGYAAGICLAPYTNRSESAFLDQNAKGCLAPSMKMVEMFYTDHGLPIDEDKQWVSDKYQMSKETDSRYLNVVPLNTEILGLHRHREPRFYADIVADGTCWYRPTSTYSATYKATVTNTKQGGNFGTEDTKINATLPQSLTGYWIKKYIDSTQPFADYLQTNVYAFKQRYLRMAELYLMSAEAWNEYLDAPDDEHVYSKIDVVRERAGIPKVREAWESYARNPQKVTTQAGMRSIIHQEWNIEFAFEGRRFYNLRRWMEAPQELNEPQYGWNVICSDNRRFYNNYEGPIVVWSKRKFTAPRDYFFPIRSEEILVSGCKQNPGWGGNN